MPPQFNNDFGWIQTYSGRRFTLLDPDPDTIVIEDIAHALANQCRYAGHCLRFYSVAEHCRILWELAPDHAKFACLMHDATEAYLIDVPRSIKEQLKEYKTIEAKLAKVIAEKFDIPYPWPEEVHELDGRILLDERAQNMACYYRPPCPVIQPTGYFWCDDEADGWPFGVEPLYARLRFYTPQQAEEKFLEAYYEERPNERVRRDDAASDDVDSEDGRFLSHSGG